MSGETLMNTLEDFNARILAVDPSDIERINTLRASLENFVKLAEPDSASEQLLRLGLEALTRIERGGMNVNRAILDAIASGISAALLDLAKDADAQKSVARATEELRALVNPAAAKSTNAPAPVSRTPAPAPKPASKKSSAMCADPELLRDFATESIERLEGAEAALLKLESAPDDKELVNTVLRAFHTVKGGAGFLGLDAIQDLAHLAENLLARCRDGGLKMEGAQAELAIESCDALKNMTSALTNGAEAVEKAGANVAELAARLAPYSGATPTATAPAPRLARCAAEGLLDNCQAMPRPPEPSEAQADRMETSPALGASAGETTARVGTARLDELLNLIGELVIAHSIIAQDPAVAAGANERLSRRVGEAGKIVRALQDLTLGLRMVPLRATFAKMTRLVRDLSHKSGKPVRLNVSGEDTEIDRTMVDALAEPLVHMIRNAVDHGIEPRDERARRGKGPEGVIDLRAYHSAGSVFIEICDDGRGLSRERIYAKAVEMGLVEASREMTDAEILALVFAPGLSTAGKVTDVSGRGVGMDVVKRSIEALRGNVAILSEPGKGTTFTLRLPLTVAMAEAMLLRVGSERLLLPTTSIEHSFRPREGQLSTVAGRGEMVQARGEWLPMFRLHKLFNIEGAVTDPSQALLLVIEGAGRRCALMVDGLQGQQQVIIKSLGRMFARVPGVSGGAILGDGRVGLILDASGLVALSHGAA